MSLDPATALPVVPPDQVKLPIPPPEVTAADEGHSEISTLWLQSRLISLPSETPKYRREAEDRPLTIETICIAARLLRLCAGRFVGIFTAGKEKRIIAWVGGKVIRGLLPTAKIWASSRMLDVVQASFSGKAITPNDVLQVAITSLLFSVGDDLFEYLLDENDSIVRVHIDAILERAYLRVRLSLPIPASSNPFISALMFDAGILPAIHYRRLRDDNGGRKFCRDTFRGPTACLYLIINVFADLLGMLAKLYLMYEALAGGKSTILGLSKSSMLIITLYLLPSILRLAGTLLRRITRAAWRDPWGQSHERAKESIDEICSEASYKQEAVLFGLRGFVLNKWDKVQAEKEKERIEKRKARRGFELGLGMMEEGIQTGFYVLLALRLIPSNLTLGSIRLYRDSVTSLLYSLKTLSSRAKSVFQLIFYMAAYTEAMDIPKTLHLLRPKAYRHVKLLNYDDHRLDGGMSITASDLDFRYPDTEKDILKGVNLTIEAGTTLAIVGLNGSGKSTPIKALMGLYYHQGSIIVNGHPIAAYDPATLHARTSCLFQDFSKYSFTLRENVGVGNVEKMVDDDAVKDAIGKGGADSLLSMIGIEGTLRRYGEASEGDGITLEGSEKTYKKPIKKGVWIRLMELARWIMDIGKAWYGGGITDMKGDTIASGKTIMLEVSVSKGSESKANDTLNDKTDTKPDTASIAPAVESLVDSLKTEELKGDKNLKAVEKSAYLSGGQWQRVALSRVFMRASMADLVIFDEPSASLDPKAEAALFEKIHSLSHQDGRKCTTIYISHRFSTVRKADQIAVVENGTISECGNHTELIAKNGRYAELYQIQKAAFED